MKVLLTGGTGFIGRALCERLVGAGHDIAVLTRDPDRAWRQVPVIHAAYRWAGPGTPPPREALAEAEAVVHLAGESVRGRWTQEKKARIRYSRVMGTRSLVDAIDAGEARPRILIAASAYGYYGDRGEETLAESAPPGDDFLAQVCREWEAESQRAARLGLRVTQVRIGLVLDSHGGALRAMLPAFRWGLGGPLGTGRQWWPWITRHDLVRLFHFVLEQPAPGPVNGVAPEPVRQREFARALGRQLHRPAVLPAPAPVLRLLLGEFATQLLSSARLQAKRAGELGFRFDHPDVDGALESILSP